MITFIISVLFISHWFMFINNSTFKLNWKRCLVIFTGHSSMSNEQVISVRPITNSFYILRITNNTLLHLVYAFSLV